MLRYISLLLIVLVASCKPEAQDPVFPKANDRKIISYPEDEDAIYIERIEIVTDLVAMEYRDQLQDGKIVELWLKGKTQTNKMTLSKYDLEQVTERPNFGKTIRYEQFLQDSVSTRELGMLTEALKLSRQLVRERKPEYVKKGRADRKYFIQEALHFISTCDKESLDYLIGIDLLLYKNSDHPEYNRRCIEKLLEMCGKHHELKEWDAV